MRAFIRDVAQVMCSVSESVSVCLCLCVEGAGGLMMPLYRWGRGGSVVRTRLCRVADRSV